MGILLMQFQKSQKTVILNFLPANPPAIAKLKNKGAVVAIGCVCDSKDHDGPLLVVWTVDTLAMTAELAPHHKG